MDAIFTDEFRKQMGKIKDGSILMKLRKAVKNILLNPQKGKELGRELSGKKSVRITPFRLIFEVREKEVIFYTFEHRKKVYEK